MPDSTYVTVGNRMKRLVDIGDDTFAEVTTLPIVMPTSWAPSTAFNARVYSDVEIQVIGTPTAGYVFQDSFDGNSYNDCPMWDRTGQLLAAITAPGRYRLPGNSFLKSRQGAGSTIMIRAGS